MSVPDDDLPWDATPFVPAVKSLETLRDAAAQCAAGDLYLTGTQTVFGEGPRRAEVMFTAQALLGAQFRVTQQRGQPLEGTGLARYVVATVHPSSILRAPDPETRAAARQAFVADLNVLKRLIDT